MEMRFPPKKSCVTLSGLLSAVAKNPGQRGKQLMHKKKKKPTKLVDLIP